MTLRQIAARATGGAIVLFCKAITAVRADWRGIEPVNRQRIYFANHTSNGDMPMIWSVLPPALRHQTRPVAASDYWLKNRLRAFAGGEVFRAVLIDRRPEARTADPVEQMVAALDEGASLIIFPEGNRNMGDDPLLPFRSGLWHLGTRRPEVELVPTWIANLTAIMPKGEIIPLPLICTVTFGAPVRVEAGEDKADFLTRAAAALLALRPETPGEPRPAPPVPVVETNGAAQAGPAADITPDEAAAAAPAPLAGAALSPATRSFAESPHAMAQVPPAATPSWTEDALPAPGEAASAGPSTSESGSPLVPESGTATPATPETDVPAPSTSRTGPGTVPKTAPETKTGEPS